MSTTANPDESFASTDCDIAFSKARSFAFAEPVTTRAKAAGARSGHAPHFGTLFGNSRPMTDVYRMIEKVGPTDASVLIIGQSGTGKELVATAIHRESLRNKQDMVSINCGAFSANLVEAELFGYERGAFTGAVKSHRGCFERASGGTLFLDEITEMPLELQVKLLRALETGRFYRLGSEQEIEVDVRVIAATNRDPNEMVAQGRLREDLLYRLAVFPLPLPSLRARDNDVEVLAQHFLDELNAKSATQKSFGASGREFLLSYGWPGNVRELRNAVQRAYILSGDEVSFDIPLPQATAPRASAPPANGTGTLQFSVGMALQDIEREVILATLEHCRGRKRETADMLGVSLKTLYNRLNEYRADGTPQERTELAA